MNINRARKTAQAVADGDSVSLPDMQAAFDRLSSPDLINDMQASVLRSVLWHTNQVNLQD